LNFKDNRGHNMWQKFKIDLKYPPPPFISVVMIKNMTVSTWEQYYYMSTLIKGGGGHFSVFLTFCHTIMSTIVWIFKKIEQGFPPPKCSAKKKKKLFKAFRDLQREGNKRNKIYMTINKTYYNGKRGVQHPNTRKIHL